MINRVQNANHYAIASETLLSIRKAQKPAADDMEAKAKHIMQLRKASAARLRARKEASANRTK